MNINIYHYINMIQYCFKSFRVTQCVEGRFWINWLFENWLNASEFILQTESLIGIGSLLTVHSYFQKLFHYIIILRILISIILYQRLRTLTPWFLVLGSQSWVCWAGCPSLWESDCWWPGRCRCWDSLAWRQLAGQADRTPRCWSSS